MLAPVRGKHLQHLGINGMSLLLQFLELARHPLDVVEERGRHLSFAHKHAARLSALFEGSRAAFAGKAGARFCIERMQSGELDALLIL